MINIRNQVILILFRARRPLVILLFFEIRWWILVIQVLIEIKFTNFFVCMIQFVLMKMPRIAQITMLLELKLRIRPTLFRADTFIRIKFNLLGFIIINWGFPFRRLFLVLSCIVILNDEITRFDILIEGLVVLDWSIIIILCEFGSPLRRYLKHELIMSLILHRFLEFFLWGRMIFVVHEDDDIIFVIWNQILIGKCKLLIYRCYFILRTLLPMKIGNSRRRWIRELIETGIFLSWLIL